MRRRVVAVLAGLSCAGLAWAAGAGTSLGASSGALDPTFGSGGKVLVNLGGGEPTDAIVQSNGDILVSLGTSSAFSFEVARFLPNGSLDPSFGAGGVAHATPGSFDGQAPTVQTDAVALQSDGRIVVAGGETNSSFTGSEFGVARFNSNGTVDQSFGSGGTVATQILPPGQSSSDEFASAVLVQGDGRILVGGSALLAGYRGDQTTGAVVRYNSNGSLDRSFGSGGIAASSRLAGLFTPSMLPGVSALGLDSAGDIFVIPAAAELSPAGQLDAGVTPATIVSSSHGGPEAFLANGQSVAADSVTPVKHDIDAQAQRFKATGGLDLTFVTPVLDYADQEGAGSDTGSAIAVEPNGQIVFGGSHAFGGSDGFGLARVNANGALDPSFGSGGTLTTTFQNSAGVTSIAIQPDGKILAVGVSFGSANGQEDVALARYLP